MSSTILKISSTDPSFVPDTIKQDMAKVFLSGFYESEGIEFITTDTIEFVDQGSNFEKVSCSLCEQNIEIEDWQNTMDIAYEKQFTDLTFITACCNKEISLNDLIYTSPAGFAKFIISISNPQQELAEKNLPELQDILGTTLRVIYAHY